ncbi:MAG TPA: VWA domain-containing protein [Blastocatellia bacterium]|nr:VWA domain-containing protein [Blastocatellia bacterium]
MRAASLLAFVFVFAATAFAQSKPQQQQPQPPAEQQQEPRIVVPTSLIPVPVIVTDAYGRFVTGLAKHDFTVREDGKVQEIADFSSTEEPFNVALLIDTSRSTKNKLGVIKKAALSFIKQLQPNDRVMIVTFDEKVRFVSDFTSDHKVLEHAVRSVESSYATSLYDAIHRTVTEKLIPLKGGRKAIVVLTDGVDTGSKLATYESTLELVSGNGIISYTIQYETRNDGSSLMRPLFFPGRNFLPSGSSGQNWRSGNDGQSSAAQQQPRQQQEPQPETQKEKSTVRIPRPPNPLITTPSTTPDPDKPRSGGQVVYVNQAPSRDRYLIATDFLTALASQSGARYYRAESIEHTSWAFLFIAEELRHQYTLTYYSNNEKRDGSYRLISVNVPDRRLVVRTRKGYRAPKDESGETKSNGQ